MSDVQLTEVSTESGVDAVSYASPRARGHIVIALLSIGALIALALVAIDLQYLDYYAILELREPTDDEWASADRVGRIEQWLCWASFLAYLGTAVAWCVWKYRCHNNLKALGATNLKYTPRRAVSAYFMPFLNLFWPYEAMREIRWASNPHAGRTVDCRPHRMSLSVVVVVWWFSFFLTSVIGQISKHTTTSTSTSTDVQHFRIAAYTSIAAEAVFLVATVVAASLVMNIVSRQERRAIRVLSAAAEGDDL